MQNLVYKHILCMLACFTLTSVHAQVTDEEALKNLRQYRDLTFLDPMVSQASIPRGSLTEKILLKTQRRLSRLLDNSEISAELPAILQEFNESLIYGLDLPPPDRYRPGLGPLTSILMADGDLKSIENIRPGDEVRSINMATGAAIPNKVVNIQRSIGGGWRQFGDPEALIASPHTMVFVESTFQPRPKYLGVFRAEFAADNREVYKHDHRGLVLEPMGRQVQQSSWLNRQMLYSLTLSHEPRTYVANQFVLPDNTFCKGALEAYHHDHPHYL